jgi:polyisoprenoid-binding protein YceI
MRTTIIFLTTVIALLQPQDARAQDRLLAIDPSHSLAQFTVTKLGFTDVTGRFMQMNGDLRWNPATPETARVRWRVEVASVKTDAENRDRTLEAPEYFDAARHPWLTFESRRVRRLDPRRLEVIGDLTMRGVTRQVTVIVNHSGTAAAPVFETSFTVDRYDYGIVGGRVMSRLIGRAVRINLKVVTQESTS